ncbi:MAG TPA: hypothetical protein VLA12_03220, partial [Planctomycetaceae bacterium]|nr:hypothetical protein [Planctomycetaceae bacterium]
MTFRFLAFSAVLCSFSVGVRAADSPNIVMIVSDDQAWTDYGFMGYEQIHTPHPGRVPGETPELFDIRNDPFETKNLAKQKPAIVQKLTAEIEPWWPVGMKTSARSEDGLSESDATPHWIWSTDKPQDGQLVHFRKEFRPAGRISSALLYTTGDDELRVFLNGKLVAESAGWDQVVHMDVADKLVRGKNVFAIRGKNGKSAAGVLLKLVLDADRNGKRTVVTDDSWLVSEENPPPAWKNANFEAKDWQQAISVAKLGGAPWTTVNETLLASLVKLKEPT